jgi:two-component SAPR family response regulator
MPILYIYIVEDDLLTAAALKRMLNRMGHAVCGIADNYNKAVDDLQKINIDLVISDIMLNGSETGIDLGRYINKHLNTPIIYHSSITQIELINEALNNLPDASLAKPVTPAALDYAINKFINKHTLSDRTTLSALM